MKKKIDFKVILMIIFFVALLVILPTNVNAASKISMQKVSVSSIANQTYTEKEIKPSITVKYNGKKLVKNKNYTVTYSNNKQIGTATIQIKGKGSYTGTIKKNFSIVPKKVTGLKITKKTTNSISMSWKKVSGITGYKVYSYNASKKAYTLVGKTKTNSYNVKSLKANTTYKFKVRAYKTIKNKQYLSTNSSVVSSTTNKVKVTQRQKDALSRAKSYLKYSSFSYQGLIDQLKYEKFTDKEAKYGVDHCGANWNAQALAKAKSYLKYSSFSYQGLIDQLKYEKFTSKQAKYGVDKCGANWNQQAVKKAQSYLKYSSFSYQELIDQLKYEKFTSKQAKYGVDHCGIKLKK